MVITQDNLIKQIADREGIDMATVRDILKSTEGILFDHLSSTSPSETLVIKLFKGLAIERTYIKEKTYSKGMFKNINCPEHVKIKAGLSKHFNNKVNDKLLEKHLLK